MNKVRAQIILSLTILLVSGALVGYSLIPNNTLRQNYGAAFPTFNATGPGYFIGPDMVISAARAAAFATVDTGQGANELYDMDQNVLTTSPVQFLSVNATQYYAGPNNVTDIFYFPESEASYIIFTRTIGGTPYYYAKNGQTGQVTGNLSDLVLIQATMDALHTAGGGEIRLNGVALPFGLYYYEDVKITDEESFGVTFAKTYMIYPISYDLEANPCYLQDMLATPKATGSSLGHNTFYQYSGNRLWQEDDYGNIVHVATFDTTGKGRIQAFAIDPRGNVLIIAGNAAPYTAYNYLSFAAVTADTVDSQQAGVYPPHRCHGGIIGIDTGAARVFLWAEYGAGLAQYRIWRVLQAGGGATFTAVLTLTSAEIGHMHSIDLDPYNIGTMYMTTGDSTTRIRWYLSTDFGVTWVRCGAVAETQQSRTLRLAFTEDYIYWLTDTHMLAGDANGDFRCELIRAPRADLSDITVLARFQDYYIGYGVSTNWNPYGLLLLLYQPSSAYVPVQHDYTPLYFWSFTENRLYQLYSFKGVVPADGYGSMTSSRYQNPQNGLIYVESTGLYTDPFPRAASEYNRVMGLMIWGTR